jgi:hypothetical protein
LIVAAWNIMMMTIDYDDNTKLLLLLLLMNE